MRIQLNKFAIKNNLPMTNDNEDVIKLIRKGTTGGLANVLHCENIAGETQINKWFLKDGVVHSRNLKWVMTHGLVYDFNSLYPSVSCSKENKLNPYTNNRMYMPSRLDYYTTDKKKIKEMINDRNIDRLFIVSLKGHISANKNEKMKGYADEDFINKCINFAPVIRNFEVTPDEKRIGSYMYERHNKIKKNAKPERKLTQLLSTMGEFMVFSTYYPWLLIDTFNFQVDDV